MKVVRYLPERGPKPKVSMDFSAVPIGTLFRFDSHEMLYLKVSNSAGFELTTNTLVKTFYDGYMLLDYVELTEAVLVTGEDN